MKYMLMMIGIAIVYKIHKDIKYHIIYPDMRVKKKDIDPTNPWPYILADNGDRIYLYT